MTEKTDSGRLPIVLDVEAACESSDPLIVKIAMDKIITKCKPLCNHGVHVLRRDNSTLREEFCDIELAFKSPYLGDVKLKMYLSVRGYFMTVKTGLTLSRMFVESPKLRIERGQRQLLVRIKPETTTEWYIEEIS